MRAGPMAAARRFLVEYGPLDQVVGVEAALYGSLALTGVGHATDKAVILGLMGETPQDVAPDAVDSKLAAIEAAGDIAPVHLEIHHKTAVVEALGELIVLFHLTGFRNHVHFLS